MISGKLAMLFTVFSHLDRVIREINAVFKEMNS